VSVRSAPAGGPAAPKLGRPRLRDLGVAIGRFPPGTLNAITDVEGVRVGHVTRIEGSGPLVPGEGPVRTGVTAVLPAAGDVFLERVFAGSYALNGAGEVMGLLQADEWGLCETPILLTSTMNAGKVADAAVTWISRKHPRIGQDVDVVIPLVGECDDSYLSDSVGRHVTDADVWAALDGAAGGPVEEGCVGAGTGMQTFQFAGGIGTSSRRLDLAGEPSVIGALALSNFGDCAHMRIDGAPVGRLLDRQFSELSRRGPAGSIVVLLATDAPLLPHQLGRICRRGALAIGRCGGYAPNNSGEFVIAWSTGNRLPRERLPRRHAVTLVLDQDLDPLYDATVDVVEEAILNAICAGVGMTGHSGHVAPALPVEDTRRLLAVLRPPDPEREPAAL
jgi:D-aminopeptidase